MKNAKTILVALLGIVLVIGIGQYCQHYQRQITTLQAELTEAKNHLPTFIEIQEMLVARGHDIKIDDKICKGWNIPGHSETLAAWESEICNDFAEPYFRNMDKK